MQEISNDEFKKIIEEYRHIVHAAITNDIYGLSRDEIYWQLWWDIYKSLPKYNPAKSKLSSYIYVVAKNRYITLIKNTYLQRNRIIRDATNIDDLIYHAEVDDEDKYNFFQIPPNQLENILVEDELKYFQNIFEKANLNPMEHKCMLLRVQGYEYREIAKILNIKTKSADNYVYKARKKLKAYFSKEEKIKSHNENKEELQAV